MMNECSILKFKTQPVQFLEIILYIHKNQPSLELASVMTETYIITCSFCLCKSINTRVTKNDFLAMELWKTIFVNF